jgi:hypothetical protein
MRGGMTSTRGLARRRSVALAALAIAGSALLAVLPAGAVGTSPSLANGWTSETHIHTSGQDSYLQDVVFAAPNDAFATGRRQGSVGGAYEFRTNVHHWNGSSWTRMNTIDREGPPATNFLEGIDATSPTDVWTVGWSRPSGGQSQTLIEHYDGSNWSIVTTPNPGAANSLQAVAAHSPTDVWAVGSTQQVGFYAVPLVLHYDGVSWSQVPFPVVPVAGCTSHATLWDVGDTPSGPGVWTVGRCEGSPGHAFIGRYLQGTWRVVSVPALPTNSALEAVHVAAWNNVWAVGVQKLADGSSAALAMHYDGVTWSNVAVPNAANVSINGVHIVSSTLVWFVGIGPVPGSSFGGAYAARLSNGTWTNLSPGDFTLLQSVAARNGRVIAVGALYGQSMILSRTNT